MSDDCAGLPSFGVEPDGKAWYACPCGVTEGGFSSKRAAKRAGQGHRRGISPVDQALDQAVRQATWESMGKPYRYKRKVAG